MIVQIGVLFVCMALAALLGAKAAREVFDIVRMQKPPAEAEKNEDTAEQKRKEERARREMENFMTYDGRLQEGARES